MIGNTRLRIICGWTRRGISLGLCFVLTVACFAQKAPQSQEEARRRAEQAKPYLQMYKEARELLKLRKFDEAERKCRSAMIQLVNLGWIFGDLEGREVLIEILTVPGNHGDAVAEFEILMSSPGSTTNVRPHTFAVISYLRTNRADQAYKVLAKEIGKRESHATIEAAEVLPAWENATLKRVESAALFIRARRLYEGDDEAFELLKEADKLAPATPAIAWRLAPMYYRRKDYSNARRYYQIALPRLSSQDATIARSRIKSCDNNIARAAKGAGG